MPADDLTRYRAQLRVDKHALDDELQRQSQVLEIIGREVAQAERMVAMAEEEVDVEEARTFRSAKAEDPKASVEAIKAIVAVDKACRTARQRLIDARHHAAEWQALSKAWYARGFDLKALAELYASDYFALTQTTIAEPPGREPRAFVRKRLDER